VYDHKIKGGHIDKAKSRWGGSIGMQGNIPIFFDPFNPNIGDTFMTKNYYAIKMFHGKNFYQVLGLEMPKTPASEQGIYHVYLRTHMDAHYILFLPILPS